MPAVADPSGTVTVSHDAREAPAAWAKAASTRPSAAGNRDRYSPRRRALAGGAAELELEDQELFQERGPVAVFGFVENVFDSGPVAAAPAAFKLFANRVDAAGLFQVASLARRRERSPTIRPPPRWPATSCGSGPAAGRRSAARSRAERRSRRYCSPPSG